ncbi:type VI secretion system Vgr family protein [Runella sp.]|uniref:type VI secretion system Vgr family protein n=1 Tax=Runella sp. TaxID=1960881 RepID=UPI003D11132A
MALTNTFTASTEITINGETIRRVNHLRIGQRFESHHDFEISVSPDMLANRSIKLRELADKFVGKKAAITLRQGRLGVTEQTQIFSGIVTSVRLVKGQSQSSTYLISGLSPTIQLSAGVTTRTFTQKALGDIVNDVLTPFDFSAVFSPEHAAPIPYVTQYEEDNFHFLQRLAEEFGEWMFYDGRDFIFGKGARQTSPTVALTHGTNLFDMEYGLRVTPLNFKASYFNYEAFKLFEADSASEQVEGLSSFSQMTFDRSKEVFTDPLVNINFTDHADENSLKTAVKLKRSEQANKLAVFTGRSPEMEMKIGGLVAITEPVFIDGVRTDTIDYGTFVVTRLNHFVDARGVYQANFEAVPQDSTFPPVDYRIVTPVARPHIAQVRSTDDPLKLGRVKVQFGWQPEGETTPFIRVSSMMTSLSKSYFIPEVHDMVMVDFEFGNPDLPYVCGSMYANDPGPRKPGDELFKADNHIKGIITRGGNHIIIDDTDGKEKIQIFNKENKNKIELSLDGGSHINIKSEGTVNISAGTINMNASKINMTGSDVVNIKGKKSVDVNSEEEVKVGSGKKMSISAGTDLNLDGKNITIKATADAKVEAGANLDLKGGPKATLKGAMVEIN